MANQLTGTNDNYGEQDDIKFNFEGWIINHGLEAIKDAFLERNMCTLNTINIMDNNNFTALMSDYRVLQNTELIPKIIGAIQSLETLRKKKLDSTKLVYMTQNENMILREMNQYIKNMDLLNDEFKTINDQYENKKLENKNKINKCEIACKSQLDDITDKIASHIGKLNEMVVKHDNMLKNKINGYLQEINDLKLKEEKVVNELDDISNNMHCTINKDKQHFEDEIIFYENTIKKYGNNYDTESENERQTELENIGNDVKHYYNTAINQINKYKANITRFLNADPVDDDEQKDDIYSININDEIYNNVWNDMNQFKIKKYDETGSDWNNIDKQHEIQKMQQLKQENVQLKFQNGQLTKELIESRQNIKKLNQEIEELQNKLMINEENKEKEVKKDDSLSFDIDSKYRWFLPGNDLEKKEDDICNIQCVKILNEKQIQLLNGKIIENIKLTQLSTKPSKNNTYPITNHFIKNIDYLFKEFMNEKFTFDFFPKKYCKIDQDGTQCISLGSGIFGDNYYRFCCVSSTGFHQGVHQWSIQCNKEGNFYGTVGVVSNCKDAIKANKWIYELGSNASYAGFGEMYMNNTKVSNSVPRWSSGDTIRIRLHCEFGTVYFWKNNEFVMEVKLKDTNKIYYPAICCLTLKSGDCDYKLL